MAEKIVDLAAKTLGKKAGSCKTRHYRLSGGEFESEEAFEKALNRLKKVGSELGIPANKVKEWFYRYGTNTSNIFDIVKSMPGGDVDDLCDRAELKYAVENEMVYFLNDFMIRRTGKIFFDRQNAEQQIDYMAAYLSERFGTDNSVSEKDKGLTYDEFSSAITFS
jgi:glycerol-3-phosphate dehydrogenase